MLSTGNKLAILGSGVLVLLVFSAFILYPLLRRAPEPVPQTPVTANIEPSTLTPALPDLPRQTSQTTIIEPLTGEEIEKDEAAQRADIERTTRLFVERFGSYSNYSNFSNITSLESLMSSSMRAYAQTLMEQGQEEADGYVGITTRVLSLSITDFAASRSAEVRISVRQEKQSGLNGETEVTLRDGRVELVYSRGTWLVDGLYYN